MAMKRIVVDDRAVREMVIEMLENSAMGDVYEPDDDSTKVSAEVDPLSSQTNPGNPDYVPTDKASFDVAVKNLVKNTPDDQLAGVYKDVQARVTGDTKSPMPTKKTAEPEDGQMKITKDHKEQTESIHRMVNESGEFKWIDKKKWDKILARLPPKESWRAAGDKNELLEDLRAVALFASRLASEGWNIRDIAAYLATFEEVNPDIDADKALQKRNQILAKTKQKSVKVQAENAIRAQIRKVIKEMVPAGGDYGFSGYEFGPDDDENSEDMYDEFGDLKPKKTQKHAYKSTALGHMADVQGASFKELADELGFSISGAKRAVDQVIRKVRWINTEYQDSDDIEILVLQAMNDYIDLLTGTGELTEDDVQLMKDHPEIVRTLDGFREFLGPRVKKFQKQRMPKGIDAKRE